MVRVPYLGVNARNWFTNKDLSSHPFCCSRTIPGDHLLVILVMVERKCVPNTGRSGKQQKDPLTCLSGDFIGCPFAKGSHRAPCPFEITDGAKIQSPGWFSVRGGCWGEVWECAGVACPAWRVAAAIGRLATTFKRRRGVPCAVLEPCGWAGFVQAAPLPGGAVPA